MAILRYSIILPLILGSLFFVGRVSADTSFDSLDTLNFIARIGWLIGTIPWSMFFPSLSRPDGIGLTFHWQISWVILGIAQAAFIGAAIDRALAKKRQITRSPSSKP